VAETGSGIESQHQGATDGVVALAGGGLEEVWRGCLRWEQQPDRQFYAASTMKLAVLIAAYRRWDRGELDLAEPLRVRTKFRSLVDGSWFAMDPEEVDGGLAARQGEQLALGELVERMITISSNEATNLVLERVGLEEVASVLSDLNTKRTVVARPIGDRAARRAGITNLVTPADLARLLAAIELGEAAGSSACREMLGILTRQHYRDEIPAGLPSGARTANKNGWVTGILHDAALVWPPTGEPYCLAVCTEGFAEREVARAAIRGVAARCYAQWTGDG
jgi:beta-lactamase class A